MLYIDIGINRSQCIRVAEAINKYVKILSIDKFTNKLYYPGESDDYESVARYFFFMVSIDHRTSRPNNPYEAWVNGEFYHGADLLYRLGSKMYHENPEFFNPKHMSKLTLRELKKWLCIGNTRLWDERIRLMLLRDAAIKLIKLYNGSVLELVNRCYKRLKYKGYGFIEQLKVFKAYEDPVEKKAYLLAKFLSRRGILQYKDTHNIRLPIDNHLTRIAFRLGIVKLGKRILNKVLKGIEVSSIEDTVIRFIVREAYYNITKRIKVNPFILDDLLWMFGRKICKRDKPLCDRPNVSITGFQWDTRGCPFRGVCRAYNEGIQGNINEHNYINTWYY